MRRILLIISILAVSPMIATSFALAHAEDSAGQDDPVSTTQEGNQKDDDNQETFAQRLARRKTGLKTKLLEFEKTRIKARCSAAQGVVKPVRENVKAAHTARDKVYERIIERLTDLSPKLKEAGLDATKLDEQIATLKTKVETFNTDIDTYKQAVADIIEVSCQADPEGFKAALEDAREALLQVNKSAKDIRQYVVKTIKPELKNLKEQLKQQSSSEDEAETEEETEPAEAQ